MLTDTAAPEPERFWGRTQVAAAAYRVHHGEWAVGEAASTARERATEKVQDRLDGQVHRATDSLQSVAQSLRTAGEQLPADNGMSRYMLQAASQVDNLASFLDNRELTELIDEVEDFARRQPTAFLGGAFALGMIGARFLKSSQREKRLRGGSQGYSRQRLGNGGYDQFSGSNPQFSGGYDQFSEDEFERQSPSTGRGGYQGGGYAGA